MGPPLFRAAPGEISHWWSQLKFRFENKKGWNEMLDETFLLRNKRINDIPFFFAAEENDVGSLRKLLKCPSTDIFQRGVLGETVLHVAVQNDSLEAAIALMDGAPELINETMTSDLFQGLSPLHIAVMNQNVNLVRELIDRGAHVDTPRVTGLYFQKRRGGLLYYGEHTLSFACCVGNQEIISMLIDAGANIRAQDSLGNTILHILVLQPDKDMACETMEMLLAKDAEAERDIPLDLIPNYRGLTLFKLAAKEGNLEVFQSLVNRRRVVQWSMGPLSSNLYDLTEIDSWADDQSVLECIVTSRKNEARNLLQVTPVRQLISLKWNLYGKHYFRFLLLVYLLYIVSFTLCCVYRPVKDAPENYTAIISDRTIRVQKTLEESYLMYEDNVRLAGEIISVLGAILILLLEIPDILRVGAKPYFGQSALGGPFHIILITYACLVVMLCVLRLSSLPGEMVLMAISLMLGWCNVLYFARGFEKLGPYVIMIQKNILGDLLKFIWLIVIVVFGFASALWMFYMTQEVDSLPPYRSFPITLFTQFELTLGQVDLPVDHTLTISPVVHVLHCIFSLVSNLLLLNMLTAIMSETHSTVDGVREELWMTQVVATILMLERRLPRCLWPRLGMCGSQYGLGDCWYLRVEDYNESGDTSEDEEDNSDMTGKGKREKSDERKRKGETNMNRGLEEEKNERGQGKASETSFVRPLQRSMSTPSRKSQQAWHVIDVRAQDLEAEKESQL
ncbi:transient receptor potential cation channel subfamily V member 6 isoform X2 [Scleropages formosus]|nr:transient receptor potential cation channel subfamily V member 5 isoform X2 [Scleropages formosus]